MNLLSGNLPGTQAARSTISFTGRALSAVGLSASLAFLSCHAFAQTAEPQSYSEFIQHTTTVSAAELLGRAESKVKDEAEIENMRQAVLDQYRSVSGARYSFNIGEETYDCIPVMEQPAVARFSITKLASPPPSATTAATNDLVDGSERPLQCNVGEIPLARLTLEKMARFETLKDFYRKPAEASSKQILAALFAKISPIAEQPRTDFETLASTASDTDNESATGMVAEQNNIGGSAVLNVWNPSVSTKLGQTLSVSEMHFVAEGNNTIQEVEVGWAVEPNRYGDTKTHLFIYATPNDFKSGCVNLTCPNFVQTADAGVIGHSFALTSVKNGKQIEITAQYQLFEGNWWLLLEGTAIGYYPGKLFAGGQLGTSAQLILYDGAGFGTGTSWPQVGSGCFPKGNTQGCAAYDRDLLLFPSSDSTKTSPPASQPAPLLPLNEAPGTGIAPSSCYTTSGPFIESSQEIFYFGGLGGSNCKPVAVP